MSIIKAKIYSGLILLSSGIYILLVYIGFTEQNIDLKQLRKYSGKVTAVGETIRYSGKGNAKVFYVKLQDLNQVLGVYRMNKNYDNLLEAIKVKDSITVYFNDDYSSDVNIDLIQVEGDRGVILKKEEFEKKESALIWIGLLGAIFSIFLAVNYYRKHVLKRQLRSLDNELLA